MTTDADLIAAFLAKRTVTVVPVGVTAIGASEREWAKAVRDPDAARAMQHGDADLGYARWEAAVQASHVGDKDLAVEFANGAHDHALRRR